MKKKPDKSESVRLFKNTYLYLFIVVIITVESVLQFVYYLILHRLDIVVDVFSYTFVNFALNIALDLSCKIIKGCKRIIRLVCVCLRTAAVLCFLCIELIEEFLETV